jgi:hypothetical protein
MEACGKLHAPAVLPAGRYSGTHSVAIELEGLWASETSVARWRKEKFLVPAGIQPPECPVHSVVIVPNTEQLICTLERILFKAVN